MQPVPSNQMKHEVVLPPKQGSLEVDVSQLPTLGIYLGNAAREANESEEARDELFKRWCSREGVALARSWYEQDNASANSDTSAIIRALSELTTLSAHEILNIIEIFGMHEYCNGSVFPSF